MISKNDYIKWIRRVHFVHDIQTYLNGKYYWVINICRIRHKMFVKQLVIMLLFHPDKLCIHPLNFNNLKATKNEKFLWISYTNGNKIERKRVFSWLLLPTEGMQSNQNHVWQLVNMTFLSIHEQPICMHSICKLNEYII